MYSWLSFDDVMTVSVNANSCWRAEPVNVCVLIPPGAEEASYLQLVFLRSLVGANGPFSSNERRLRSCLRTTNEGQPSLPPPVGIHWHRAVVLIFVAFYAPYQRELIKESQKKKVEIRAKIYVGTMFVDRHFALRKW
ncbi:unnamed protein product [Ixodes pacificus]